MHSTDITTYGFNSRLCDRLSREQRIDCIAQLMHRRFITDVTDSELIVDSSPISENSTLIQNEDFRRAFGLQLIGDAVPWIL